MSNVKYTLLGFNQEMLCFFNKEKWIVDKNGETKRTIVSLQPQDLFVLDWFLDDIWKLRNRTALRTVINPEDGQEYVNIQYSKTSEYFPFLFRNKYTVTQSMERMVYLGLLKSYHYKTGGRYSCFRPNDELLYLISYNKKRVEDGQMEEAFNIFLDKFVVPNGLFLLKRESEKKDIPSSKIT